MAGPVQPPRPPFTPPPPYPGTYPYPGGYPPPSAPAPSPRRAEYVIAWTVWFVTAAVLPLFWFYSLFAMMGVDACSDTSPCQYGFIYGAYGVGWIAAAASALFSGLGLHVAKKRGRPAWPWALAGVLAMAACVVGWYLLYKAGLP